MNTKRSALALTGCLLAAASPFVAVPAWAQAAPSNAPPTSPAQSAPPPGGDDQASDNQANGANDAVRPFSLGGGVSLSEFLDTNAGGVPGGPSDATTQGEFDIRAHDQTDRFQGDLSYSLAGNLHASQSNLNSVQNYLNAIGHAEIVPEQLFLSARAFAWPTFITRLGPLDAGNGSAASGNANNAYGYVVTPDFALHFDEFAKSDLSVTQSGEFFSNLGNTTPVAFPFAGPASAQSTTVSERLESGEDFDRLQWVLTASGTDSAQTNFHQRERLAEGDFEYHFDHSFALLADVGYRRYASRPSLTHGLSGMIAMGGFAYQPEETLSIVFKAGRQYNFDSYTGDIAWQITGETAFRATLDDVVTTPQQRLLIGLNGLTAGPNGFTLPGSNLPDQSLLSGLPAPSANPVNTLPLDGLALDNALSRYRTLTAGLLRKVPRWSYSLTFYGTVRDYLLPVFALDARQTVYGFHAGVTHDLTRDMSATLGADYSVAREFGGLDKIFSLNAILTYTLSPEWSVFGTANFVGRSARNSVVFNTGNADDLQLGAGLRYNF